MTGRDSIQSILTLRKLTRAIADVARAQMVEYLVGLTPLLQPRTVFGEYIQGGQKDSSHKAEKALKELQPLYEKVAAAKPFLLPRELNPPFSLSNVPIEITPLDYTHMAQAGGAGARKILVRRPLTWVLSYSGYAPTRLQELLDTRMRAVDALQRYVIAHLVLHLVIKNQPGVAQMLNALHFPITTTQSPESGELPVTLIGVAINTSRPADALILESAELTGMDAFEEVINPEDIVRLSDPLRDRLVEIARTHAPEVV